MSSYQPNLNASDGNEIQTNAEPTTCDFDVDILDYTRGDDAFLFDVVPNNDRQPALRIDEQPSLGKGSSLSPQKTEDDDGLRESDDLKNGQEFNRTNVLTATEFQRVELEAEDSLGDCATDDTADVEIGYNEALLSFLSLNDIERNWHPLLVNTYGLPPEQFKELQARNFQYFYDNLKEI